MRFGLKLILLVIIGSGLSRCSESHKYALEERRELASGANHDSLFLGFYLGMPAQDFYDRCWDLNKQGLIMEGPANATVQYRVQDLSHPASVNFYPGFYEGKIIEMPMSFSYDSWAPWNKLLYAEPLQLEVLNLMETWFGKGFYTIENPADKETKAFVKIDGNRRISIYPKNDQYVNVDIVDLRMMRALKNESNEGVNM